MTGFKELIFRNLSPLIGKKCVLPDLPYYPNVGDLLIWEGMERFLKDNGTECLWRSSISTFKYRPLSEDVCICLVGGGNFGDLWRSLHEFKNKIVQLYPNNRIIVFPQSVYYSDLQLCNEDVAVLATHKDVHICARDKNSFDFLNDNFQGCQILLVPDMALYLDFEKMTTKTNRFLFLKRDDIEAIDYSSFNTEGMDVLDWPMNQFNRRIKWAFSDRFRHKLIKYRIKKNDTAKAIRFLDRRFSPMLSSNRKKISEKWCVIEKERAYLLYLNKQKYSGKLGDVIDWFFQTYYKPISIQFGVSFINQYDVIYATRLHAGILGLLLGKEVHLIDNSYGKISAFFNTWKEFLIGNKVSIG